MTAGARERCVALLKCPVCDAALAALPGVLRCPRGHAFDVAREGYVNLLPAGHGRSGKSGDAAEMIRARARFLERGYYDGAADAIAAAAGAALADAPAGDEAPAAILDAGCGTGHYLARVGRAPAAAHACLLGCDISRDAVRLAARRHPAAFFFVNDVTHRLSLADGAVHLLLNVFAPRNAREFARVVRPGGGLVVVVPTDDHLHELREMLPLLEVGPEKEARVLDMMGEAFEPVQREIVRGQHALPPNDIADLLHMTPSAWHLPEQAWQEAARLDALRVSFGFILLRFRRR